MNIMQGDAYNVEFEVKLDGTAIDATTVETAEFMIGKLKKTYPDAVTYNSVSGKFLFPITQAESFALFTALPVDLDKAKSILDTVKSNRLFAGLFK